MGTIQRVVKETVILKQSYGKIDLDLAVFNSGIWQVISTGNFCQGYLFKFESDARLYFNSKKSLILKLNKKWELKKS